MRTLKSFPDIKADHVIDRMKAALEIDTDADLAMFLKSSKSTVSSWRKRNSIPYAECVQISASLPISVDWLLTGEAPRTAEADSFDDVVLEIVVTALEQYLYERNLIMPPERKGKAIVALYKLVMRDESDYQALLNEAAIDAFLKSAISR